MQKLYNNLVVCRYFIVRLKTLSSYHFTFSCFSYLYVFIKSIVCLNMNTECHIFWLPICIPDKYLKNVPLIFWATNKEKVVHHYFDSPNLLQSTYFTPWNTRKKKCFSECEFLFGKNRRFNFYIAVRSAQHFQK